MSFALRPFKNLDDFLSLPLGLGSGRVRLSELYRIKELELVMEEMMLKKA